MGFRMALLILMLSVAAMAVVAHSGEYQIGKVEEEEEVMMEEEMMMESEAARRQLRRSRYISYGALNRNNVPCDRRGRSYYNCRSHQRANPYNRGCTRVTNCARASR